MYVSVILYIMYQYVCIMCMNDPGIVEGELKVICLILSFTFLSSATYRLVASTHPIPHLSLM